MSTILLYVTVVVAILLVLDAVVIGVLVNVVRKAWAAKPDIMGRPSAATVTAGANRRSEAVRTAWAEIEEGASRGVEGKRLAVINADRLVDHLLKDAGYEGEGALDRMKALPRERVASVSDLLAAHRFRNRLVHEVGFTPDERSLDTAIAQYRSFLTEVGYLA